jgi:putative GTP pyrophosphokinase
LRLRPLKVKNKRVATKVPERREARSLYVQYRPQYDVVLRRIYRRVRDLLVRNDIEATIKYRIKRFENYYEKLVRMNHSKNAPVLLNDILGIRIVCPFLEDIDNVEKLINENFSVIEVDRKGIKHSSGEFGYDSIHLLVDLPPDSLPVIIPFTRRVCEIQIRTILQDAWAEVEHELIYKADFSPLNEAIKKKLASLNATLTLSDIIFQEIRDYQREIKQLRDKRRESLHEKIQAVDEISLLNNVGHPTTQIGEGSLTIPKNPQNQLDKLIFEALDAHSRLKYDQAIRTYTRILGMKLNKQVRSVIYNHRGMAYFVQSEYKGSIRDFSRAIDYSPDNFRALNNRGLAYRMLHQYENALRDFDRSLEINSFQVEGYYSRALLYYDLSDFSKALEDCTEALNIKPEFVPAQRLKTVIDVKIFNS